METILIAKQYISTFGDTFNEPTYSVDLSEHGEILAVHYSPYEWSQDILLIAFTSKILVAQLNQDTLEFDVVAEFQHDVICTNIYLSSETATNIVPINIQFCTAGVDFKLRVFKGNISDENTYKELTGHTSYINDINYDPDNIYIVSVSDDHTARIWSTTDNKHVTTLRLTSPGISACWHRDDNSKLLIAEKIGTIRFYNISTQKPILSFDYGKPLASAHWAQFDSQLVASLQMGELLLWDMTRSSRPIQNKLIYTEAGGEIKFSPGTELIATLNRLEKYIKVLHVQTQQERLYVKLSLPTNITWHFRIPVLCAGDGTKLCFWRVAAK